MTTEKLKVCLDFFPNRDKEKQAKKIDVSKKKIVSKKKPLTTKKK